MHIAIEGLDGVGKTSTAKKLAELLRFELVEKPLHLVTDENGDLQNYLAITSKINSIDNHALQAHFYAAGNILTSMIARQKNIVTDRHLVSNYYNNATVHNLSMFDELIAECGCPHFTFVLYANAEIRRQRIIRRNPQDADIRGKCASNSDYEKIRQFFERYDMPHKIIDTSSLSLEKVVNIIFRDVQELLHPNSLLSEEGCI